MSAEDTTQSRPNIRSLLDYSQITDIPANANTNWIAALPPDVREVSDLPKCPRDSSGLRPEFEGVAPENVSVSFGGA
jgi:hypothetical protein